MGIVRELRDGLTNLMTGAGTIADKRSHAAYAMRHADPAQIEAAYRSSWLMRKVVDLPPQDETREWRRWQAAPATIAAIEAEERRLDLRHKIRRARVLARLHGGGAILLGIGGDDPAAPLDPARVGRGALRYAHVLSRWELGHGAQRRDPEDAWFGQPQYFTLRGEGGVQARLHPSRVVAFVGQPLPEASALGASSWFWGDPLLQSIEDAVKNADAAQNGFAALIDEAKVDVFGIPDLLSSLASRDYEERLLRRLSLAKLGQSTHNAKLKDASETWETRQVSWAGMPEIIDRYLQLVAGAAGGAVTMLGVVGGGIRWLFTSRSKREEWIETRIQSHVSKIEARLAVAERRADHLGFAFQLVAAELARLDPDSDILRRAQLIIEGVQGVFGDSTEGNSDAR